MNWIQHNARSIVLLFLCGGVIALVDAQYYSHTNAGSGLSARSESSLRLGSQCWEVKGIPTITLQCPAGQMVKVLSAFHGAPTILSENVTCSYQHGQSHCTQRTELTDNCMGTNICTLHVNNPFLIECQMYAKYMQVNYTCVPKWKVLNICSNKISTVRRGYMSSPAYPSSHYYPNMRCSCTLHTRNSGIQLSILDMSLNQSSSSVCDSDYLQISAMKQRRMCGTIGPEQLPQIVRVDSGDLTLTFVSDNDKEGKGIWLQFEGYSGSKVTSTCKIINTSISTKEKIENTNAPVTVEKAVDELPNTQLLTVKTKEATVTKDTPRWIPASMIPQDSQDTSVMDDINQFDLPNKQSHENDIYWERREPDSLDNALLDYQGSRYKNRENLYEIGAQEKFLEESSLLETDEDSIVIENVAHIQIITGCVVGLLILIAVIVIIVLVFKR